MHQNDLKTHKKKIKVKKKIKFKLEKNQLFLKTFLKHKNK